jgi:hypothetical protein
LEEVILDSDSDLEMDNVSDDDSLPGPNEEWLQSSKKGRNGQNRSTSIDVTHPLPRLDYEDIPVMFQGPEDAEKVNRYFVVERRSEPMPGDDKTDVGDTPGIEGFEVWLRGDYGCGLRSALDRCPHYDTNRGGYNRLRRRAKRNKLPFLHIPKGTTTIVNGMHNLFLSNEDQFEDEINDLDLEGIFKDCMVKEHPTDSTKMKIAGRNKRGNRGLSLGFTSGHSLKKDVVTGIAGPQIVIDTWRYVPVAIKFSNLQKTMSKASGFELFDEEQFPERQFNWAQKIDDEVINELFSLLYLVHDDPKSLAYSDWLKKHVDSQNCPHWSFLGFAWKTFFYPPIGRYITGVITANWKKSVSDLQHRTDVISLAADFIIQQLLVTPKHLLTVTADTFCSDNEPKGYRVLPIHTDPFVHLSPLIYSICRLRRFLSDVVGIRMSSYLRDEMITAALVETNNMYRYSKFAQQHYDLWESKRTDPVEIGSTFLDTFQIWLRTNYSSNEGNHLRNNEKEGTVRYMCSRNTPSLVQTTHNNVRSFHYTMADVAKMQVTDALYKKTIQTLDKQMEGVSDLKIQKMIYVCAVVGGQLQAGWIDHCRPGSPRHLARFKKQDFALTTQNQVGQVVKVIAQRHGLPLPVAEESVCSKLKSEEFGGCEELAIKGQDLFSCRLNTDGLVEVWGMDWSTKGESMVQSGGFSYGNQAHYRPSWSRGKNWALEYGLKLRFTSDENLKFNIKKKTTAAQRKQLSEETIFSSDYIISSKNVQVLLNKNRSLVIDIAFVSSVFQIEQSVLRSSIRVESVGGGYAAYIDQSVFEKVKSLRYQVRQVRQIDQVKPCRQPQLYLLPGKVLAYTSKSSAVMALLLHLLTNVKRKTGKSWTFQTLKDTRELILIVPVARNNTTMQVTATLFRQEYPDGAKVMCRYLNTDGKAEPAFEVAVDDDGFFDED